jgi:signal peptidase II
MRYNLRKTNSVRSSIVLEAQRRRWLVPLIIGFLILISDQLSKRWIVQTLGPSPCGINGCQTIPLMGNWMNIIYSRNTGVAFGLFQHMSPVLTIVSLLISIGAVYVYAVYLPNQVWSVQISIGLIVGGAIGNIVDRLRLGYVIDFIQVGWWPVFNLADSAISVGATILAVYLMLIPDENLEPAGSGDDALLTELLQHDVGTLERDQGHTPPHSQR